MVPGLRPATPPTRPEEGKSQMRLTGKTRMMLRPFTLMMWTLLPLTAAADPLREGEALVRQNCAACHAVTQEDASPNPRAIPFRFLGRLYHLPDLEEALVEGIMVGHEMPEFELDSAQAMAVISYLDSIQFR